MAYLSGDGLQTLWGRIKSYVTGLGYTSNVGTVTGVKMNNGTAVSPDANGVVNLGTVITDVSDKANTTDLATVATTGAYSDLSGTPSNIVIGTASITNIEVVSSMPASPDSTTLYIVTGS